MGFFKITKNDGTIDQKALEKSIDVLTRISDQSLLMRETSNIQDIDGNGGLVSPLKIEITSSRDSDGVTLSQYATLKATWAPSPYATSYDVECNTGEVEGEETKNKTSLTNTCFWENMTLGTHVKVRIRSVNTAYKSEWSDYAEYTIPPGDYKVPGPVITANKLFRWIHASVPKVDRRLYPNHRGFEWQWSFTNDFTTIEKEDVLTQGTGDTLVRRKLSFSNHCVFWVTSLTKTVYLKCRAYDKDNNKGSWSISTAALIDGPATIDSVTPGVVPIFVGFFKRVQYRLNVQWAWSVATGNDPDMHGCFEIQYRRLIGSTPGPIIRHFIDLDNDDTSPEHNIPLLLQPRNTTTPANGYKIGDLTNIILRVRARENLIAGGAYPVNATSLVIGGVTCPITTITMWGSPTYWVSVPFVEPDTEDTFTYPTPQWSHRSDGAFGRFIVVKCCEDAWDAPNTFSHFSIHARIRTYVSGGNYEAGDWSADTRTLSFDRVKGGVSLEAGVNGVIVRIPWLLLPANSSPVVGNRRLLLTKDFNHQAVGSVTHSCLEIMVVPHIYKSSSSKFIPGACLQWDAPHTDGDSYRNWSRVYRSTDTGESIYDGMNTDTGDTYAMEPPSFDTNFCRIWFGRIMHLTAVAPTSIDYEHLIKHYIWTLSVNSNMTDPLGANANITHESFRRSHTMFMPTINHKYASVATRDWSGNTSTPVVYGSTVPDIGDTIRSLLGLPNYPTVYGSASGDINHNVHIQPEHLGLWKRTQYCIMGTVYIIDGVSVYPELEYIDWKIVTNLGITIHQGTCSLTKDVNNQHLVADIVHRMPFLPLVKPILDLTNGSGRHIYIRGHYPLRPISNASSWVNCGEMVYGSPGHDAVVIPAPDWDVNHKTMLPRDIDVTCVPDYYWVTPWNWDFPDHFSHFSVHARFVMDINHPVDWLPDIAAPFEDLVCTYVGANFVTKPLRVRIPWWLLRDDGTDKEWNDLNHFNPTYVQIKLAMWVWEADSTTGCMTLVGHNTNTASSAPTGGGSAINDIANNIQQLGGTYIVGDPYGKNVTITGSTATIESNDYVGGATGFHISPELIEATNLKARGTLSAVCLKYDSVNSLQSFMITPSAALSGDMTDSQGFMYVNEPVFIVGDVVRLQPSGTQAEDFLITSGPVAQLPTGYYYEITRAYGGIPLGNVNIISVSLDGASKVIFHAVNHGLTTNQQILISGYTGAQSVYNGIAVVVFFDVNYFQIARNVGVNSPILVDYVAGSSSGVFTKYAKYNWAKGTAVVKFNNTGYLTGHIKMFIDNGIPKIQLNKTVNSVCQLFGNIPCYAELSSKGLNVYKGGDITLEYHATDPAKIIFGSEDYEIKYHLEGSTPMLTIGSVSSNGHISFFDGTTWVLGDTVYIGQQATGSKLGFFQQERSAGCVYLNSSPTVEAISNVLYNLGLVYR